MTMSLARVTNFVRSKGDPKIVSEGPSSLDITDRTARNLGWFSIGLGLVELLAAERVTRALGMEGKERVIRAYGAREIAAGVLTLSTEKKTGVWSRVAGDGLDIATLLGALHPSNPKNGNVALALLMVGGITLLDFATAQQLSTRHARGSSTRRYDSRTGYPNGIEASRGIAARKAADSARSSQS